MRAPLNSSIRVACLVSAWGLTVGAGYLLLGDYHARRGRQGSPPDHWLSGALVSLDRTRPTLLIFLHPRCPCSRASKSELARVAARCRGQFAAHLFSFRPEGPAPGWDKFEPDDGYRVPGIRSWTDKGGSEALRFGVETSGHILLYDPSGRLLFSGGITPSRGHEGDNRGLDDLVNSIRGDLQGPWNSPVYGCPVLAPALTSRPEVAR